MGPVAAPENEADAPEGPLTPAQVEAGRAMAAAQAARLALFRRLFEEIGFPLLCHERACARSRRCRSDREGDPRVMPPCFVRYRDELRFLLDNPLGLANQRRLAEGGEAALPPEGLFDRMEPGPGFTAWIARLAAADPHAPTLLESLYGTDPGALARLRREPGRRGPADWEYDPEGFAAYMASGDWRRPPSFRPRPVRVAGRLITCDGDEAGGLEDERLWAERDGAAVKPGPSEDGR